MKAGRIFRNMREGVIAFPPTYKFNKWDPDTLGYDTSEKRRVPAWTDRVFFRGTLRRDIPDVSFLCTFLQCLPSIGYSQAQGAVKWMLLDLLAAQ